jgi:hypothetical protein
MLYVQLSGWCKLNIRRTAMASKEKFDAIIIASGLPRSGTSMMMRMLEAGGMPIMTDNIRKADVDNPRGYYEFERAKKIKADSSWLEDCRGKAVKMVSALLFDLPLNDAYIYRVIFMERYMCEILASQKKMLERRKERGAGLSDEKMAASFKKHLGKVENWMQSQDTLDVLFINYNDAIAEPLENARLVNFFLGNRLNEDKMAAVVEERLYRQRKKGK